MNPIDVIQIVLTGVLHVNPFHILFVGLVSIWAGVQGYDTIVRVVRRRRLKKQVSVLVDSIEEQRDGGHPGPYRKAAEKSLGEEEQPKVISPAPRRDPKILPPQKKCPRCGKGETYSSSDPVTLKRTILFSPAVMQVHVGSNEPGCVPEAHAHAACAWCRAEWLERPINDCEPP